MSSYSDIAIIFNPHSTGDAPGNAHALHRQLELALPKAPVKLLPTQRAGHAWELAYNFAVKHKNPLIISASGDGGYNEVINGALQAQAEGSKSVCAVLPSGNANDHARTMHTKPLLELILDGHVRELDILQLHAQTKRGDIQRYAHSYIGIGLTPKVAIELNQNELNTFKEGWIITKSLWNLRPVRIKRHGKTMAVDSLICSTIPEMAKVLTLSSRAHPQDGMFEITTLKHRSKSMLLLQLAKGAVIQLGSGRRADKLHFTLLQPSPIQLDGEIVQLPKRTEVAVTIRPKFLRSII
jgi:diacylglycerol kinase family enzyme